MVTLDDFTDDVPFADDPAVHAEVRIDDQIEGVHLRRLVRKGDSRGDLTVLLSRHYDAGLAVPPHVYLITATPGSLRAWVYHRKQADRLAFTAGEVRVVLYDLRPESPTYRKLNVLDVGASNPVTLTIPPRVVHGVQNRGKADVQFINMPTHAYNPADPDKARLRWDHPGIPYSFA